MSDSLRAKTVKGVGWSALDNFIHTFLTFLITLVLARLLTPGDYGLIGMTAIFTSICNTLVNGGFLSALIRKNNLKEEDYNTAFFVNVLTSLILYLIIFISSPFIADFFNKEELSSLLKVSSITLIIGAVTIVQQARIHRNIDFKSQAKATFFSSIISGITGISMALMGFGVWSLVYQIITASFFNTLFLISFNRWIPKFSYTRRSFHELFGFGWKIMMSNIIGTIWEELNQVVVGKFYNAATLGQFARAKQFSSLFSANLASIIQRVTYPVLSGIQDDKPRMLEAYKRIIKSTMFVSVIVMSFIAGVSDPLLYCLIGPQWSIAAEYLPLICITGSFYPLHVINLNMLQVQGRSDLFLELEIVKKVFLIVPLLIGALIGIMPMLYADIVASIICFFINSFYSGRMIGYSSWAQIKDVIPSYGIAVFVFVSVYFLKYIPITFWFILPLQCVVGLIAFGMICKISNFVIYREVKEIVLSYFGKSIL